MFKDIKDFHEKYGLQYNDKPRLLGDEMSEFRIKFMHEELAEYIDAVSKANAMLSTQSILPDAKDSFNGEMAKALDALVDLAYVALGTAYLHGFDFQAAWDRVHAANMQKVRAEKAGDSKRGTSFDVIKPPGWVAPDHTDLVEDNAHKENFI